MSHNNMLIIFFSIIATIIAKALNYLIEEYGKTQGMNFLAHVCGNCLKYI